MKKKTFSGKRCSGDCILLDLFCPNYNTGLFLYAQPGTWCAKRVSCHNCPLSVSYCHTVIMFRNAVYIARLVCIKVNTKNCPRINLMSQSDRIVSVIKPGH